jgi:hypothetical protein
MYLLVETEKCPHLQYKIDNMVWLKNVNNSKFCQTLVLEPVSDFSQDIGQNFV